LTLLLIQIVALQAGAATDQNAFAGARGGSDPTAYAVPVHADRCRSFDPRMARLNHPDGRPAQLCPGRPGLLAKVPNAHHQAVAHQRG
jgi:hypothetical protein